MKLRRSRLTALQTEHLLEHFVAGTPARPAAELVGVNRNTARLFYHRVRELIARRLEEPRAEEFALEAGVCGPRATPLFGLFERDGRVCTVMLSGEAAGNAVLRVSALSYQRIAPAAHRARQQIDRAENFWKQARQHLHKFGGIPRRHFHLFLKDCEWRFNDASLRRRLQILQQWIDEDYST